MCARAVRISSPRSASWAGGTFKTICAARRGSGVEIWAEATRNPEISALQTEFDRGLNEQFIAVFDAAKQAGAISPSISSRFAASIITKLADGLFVRRATANDFDPEREVEEVFAVIGALLSGAIKPPETPSRSEV